MKVLIFSENPHALSSLTECATAASHVVIPCMKAGDLIKSAAATEPHIVTLASPLKNFDGESLEKQLRAAGFQMPVVILKAEDLGHFAAENFKGGMTSTPAFQEPEISESQDYEILTETRSESGNATPDQRVSAREQEESKFLALLTSGSTHHERARRYFESCEASKRNHEQDWATAAICGGTGAYMWRAQLFRYVSILAHYVPGIDVDCLPLPKPLSAKLDFLHNALSTEAFYGLKALRSLGTNPILDRSLWEIGQVETSASLKLSDVTLLAGWASIVRQAASGHLTVMELCLANQLDQLSELKGTRIGRNHWSLFVETWNLRSLGIPDLRRLCEDFRNGRRAAHFHFCSFYEFVDQMHKDEGRQIARN